MTMHAVHKIMAEKSGLKEVEPGQLVTATVDYAGINDIYLTVLTAYEEMGGGSVWDPDKLLFFFDHNAPSPTEGAAYNHREMRRFAQEQGVKKVFEVNEGICHMLLPENKLVMPGSIVLVTDSHSTTHGAFGLLSTGVGSTDLAVVMKTGKLWFRVPEVIKINLEGKLQDHVMAKDIVLYLLGELGTSFGVYKTVEYTGEVVKQMEVEERMVLCNMAVEMGAKNAYIQPDGKTIEYLDMSEKEQSRIKVTDQDFKYFKEYSFDVSELDSQVAMPHSVDNCKNVIDVHGEKMDQIFIGSCTGGKLTDIAVAAKILAGKKVAKGTRLIVTHASMKVLEKSIELGYYQTLLKSGAAITTPGCGACFGGHSGILSADEKCATTSNRNFPGRMGSKEADVYLVSPATAAASAITGVLTHPKKV